MRAATERDDRRAIESPPIWRCGRRKRISATVHPANNPSDIAMRLLPAQAQVWGLLCDAVRGRVLTQSTAMIQQRRVWMHGVWFMFSAVADYVRQTCVN